MLDNFILSHPGQYETEPLRLLRADYTLMMEYWRRGYDDPARQQLYSQLLKRAYRVASNMARIKQLRETSYMKMLNSRACQSRQDWSEASLRGMLEEYVSSVAMLSLVPEDISKEQGAELHKRHQHDMHMLFDYIWTGMQWREEQADAYISMLLSPTVDSRDQQLIVSAVTIAALNAFDPEKFRAMTTVYQQSSDAYVRQRALVGWVLCADASKAKLFPQVATAIARLCDDEQCRQDLVELQMQLMLCIATEADSRRIRNEIMPDLMNNGQWRVTSHGIEEVEDDSLENILHPDAAEQNIERMEESMHKMMDMQKQGSDIYFGGFSQMKRFPFFDDVSNWFAPFNPDHPGISHIWHSTRSRKFLHTITRIGAFCDSDKYSFVLAFQKVLDHMPPQLLQLIEQGEATPMPVGGELSMEEQREPAFIRRVYLQNLYRFFRLYPMRTEFVNPFEGHHLFFANSLFVHSSLQQHYVQIAAFMAKRKMKEEAVGVLWEVSDAYHDFSYYMLRGSLTQAASELRGERLPASVSYREADRLRPGNERTMASLARALFSEQQYAEALQVYTQLVESFPDHTSYELGVAVCQLYLGMEEEALQLLYKLNYHAPSDRQVERSLAWALVVNGKQEQASKHYEQLVSGDHVQSSDHLNYGYCLWLQRHVEPAARQFALFAADMQKVTHGEHYDFEKEFFVIEHDLVSRFGISDAEVQLMIELIAQSA